MIQPQTLFNVANNSGARKLMLWCFSWWCAAGASGCNGDASGGGDVGASASGGG